MRDLRSRLAAVAVGALLIAPAAVGPLEAGAAGTPTPPPDPTSAYCKQFVTSVKAIQDAIAKQQAAPANDSSATIGLLNAIAKGLQQMSSAQPPAFLATQVKEQATYWAGAADAISKNNILSPYLDQKRAASEQTIFSDVMSASATYCGSGSTSSASPTTPKSSASPSAPKSSASPAAPKSSTPPVPLTPDSVNLSVDGLSPAEPLAVSDAKTTKVVKVTAGGTGAWTAKSNSQSWLKVRPAQGRSGGQFTLTASRNRGIARSGTITVTSGTASQTITVNQSGKAVLKAALDPTPVAAEGGSVTVTLTTDPVVPTAGATVSMIGKVKKWIPSSTAAEGSVTLTVAQNTTGKARTGNVTIKLGGSSAVIKVSQAAS